MKLKTYQKMKDSGIEWIGKIPEHWQIMRIKNIGKLYGGYAFDSKNYVESGIRLLKISNVSHGQIIWNEETYLPSSYWRLFPNFQLKNNDLVMAMTRPVIDSGLKISFFNEDCDCLINQRVGRFILDSKINAKFLFYFFNQKSLIEQIDFRTSETLQPNISSDDVEQIPIWIPTPIEQKQISDFLDTKTKLIDSEIQSNQKLITLLQEKRQAIINHAVTKGLDPTVPMKDSGIEWIGKIPKHWETTSLDLVCQIQLGKMLQPQPDSIDDILIPYLNTDFVQWNDVKLNDLPQMWISKNKVSRYQVEEGDLLVCEGGSYPGRSAIVPKVESIIIIQNALHRLRSIKNSNMKFVFYILFACRNSGWIDVITNKSTMNHLTREKLSELKIPFPSTNEQETIVDFLDLKMEQIDHMINLIQHHVDKLQEFRQSLISAAVTGKIDVRN